MLLAIIYLLVTGAVLVSAAALVFRGKNNDSNRMFLICQLLVAVWCSSQLLQILADSLVELKFVYTYGNAGICFIGCAWLWFSILYEGENGQAALSEKENGRSGSEGKEKFSVESKHRGKVFGPDGLVQSGKIFEGVSNFQKLLIAIPLLISIIHFVLAITNDFHHFYYRSFELGNVEHGPAFFTNVVATYIMVVVGAILLIKGLGKKAWDKGTDVKDADEKDKGFTKGPLLIVAAVLIPVIFNALYLLGFVEADFDITPLGFAISVFLVMMATFKYQFIDLRRELAITNEKLLLSQERNRIAQEVHDTTGHTLTMLQSYMKLTEVSIKEDNKEEALDYVRDARKLSSQGIRQLRESINQLRSEAEYELVTQAVMQLADQVKEIPVEVTVRGRDSEKYSLLTRPIHDTVRECITNTLKYAKASKIDIVIRFHENSIDLMVADDGVGCSEIKENNGIRGIRERVEKAGGKVCFITGEGEGFMTRASIKL